MTVTVEFTSHGHAIALRLPDPTDLIQRKIQQRNGFYEPELLEDARSRVRPGDLCLDVGAHLGNHTVFLARVCGARVWAFEPQPELHRALDENVALNGLGDRVRTFNVALGDAAGKGTIVHALAGNTGSGRLSLEAGGGVTVATVDEIVGDERVALMKIDVEGFELEVLKGAARTIARDRPVLYAEAADARQKKSLEQHLLPLGYVAVDEMPGTPVLVFVCCRDDAQRLAAVASRLARAQQALAQSLERQMHRAQAESERSLQELADNLNARAATLENRVASVQADVGPGVEQLERRVAEIARGLEGVAQAVREQSAMLYELWHLGIQSHDPMLGAYRPLGEVAAELAGWRPRRKSWTVPKGTEAEDFLQGVTTRASVHPGGTLEIRLSTDRRGLFAKIRAFRVGAFGRLAGEEVHVSPALNVPVTGVWRRGMRGEPDLESWPIVHRLPIGEDWRPGLYLLRFETLDGAATLHPFWVTSAQPSTRTVFLASVLSHVVRNKWGVSRLGKLLARFRKLRLARPYSGSRGGRAIRYELPFARWADANGIPLDCLTDLDVHERPELLAGYEQVVIAGDANVATRELVEALGAVRARGGRLSAFGVMPGEREAVLDLPAGTLSLRGESAAWRRTREELWRPTEGQVFVAGSNEWAWKLDDFIEHPGVTVSPETGRETARVLGVPLDEARRNPLVSVIMTAYDSASYIGAAIDSILAQSYTHLELIVVDDASSDDTFEVLKGYAARDPRVRPFRSPENHGTYWCKNFGMTRARGQLITFQDSDDVSEADRLLLQLEPMRRNLRVVATVADYVRVNEQGEILMNRGVKQRRAFPSLLFRVEEVLGRIGFFDSVRSSADQEHFHRLRLVYGADKIVELRQPLYKALTREGSLTRSAASFVSLAEDPAAGERLAHLSEARRRYVLGYEKWHRRIARGEASAYLPFPPAERPFEAPGELVVAPRPGAEQAVVGLEPDAGTSRAAVRRPSDELDVVMVSDFRFPGGTSQSNAEEIKAQARRGLKTGLVQVPSPVLKRNHPIHPVIRSCVEAGMARFIPPGSAPRCKLLVIRHPTVLAQPREMFPPIEAGAVAVIVNQAPLDVKTGRVAYDLLECQKNAEAYFGALGTWFPIGPLVRKAIEKTPGLRNLSPEDWHNIINLDEWRVRRDAWVGDRPVIGRHSRDSSDKWPDEADKLLQAYPKDGELKVRILGGAEYARQLLGYLPEAWEVLEFGTAAPRDFLAGIDFFVYYHHPQLVEAFGRTILEALATGAPVILPPHFADLFGEVALLCETSEVRRVVRELYADRARYQAISRKGIELVERRFSWDAHVRRLEALMGAAPVAAPVAGSTELEPHSVYKIEVEVDGVPKGARGVVRGVLAASGRRFEVPLNGEGAVSAWVMTDGARDRVDVSVSVEGAAPVARVKARRRADRPRQPQLDLAETSITAAMATYPGRRTVVPAVIDSLVAQVDKLFVYLNNYDDVPPFLRTHPAREKIVFVLDPASQRRAAAKFYWLDKVRGYHLVCDDDILYPADYARRMVEAIDRRGRRAIVGVHGVVFQPIIEDAKASRRSVFKFPEALADDTPVHFLGTGTVALHTDVLAGMDMSLFQAYPIANDEILAVSAKQAGVPMICVARASHWMKPHPEVKFGIFEERVMDGGEHQKATSLLASANPWPEPTSA